MEIKLRRLTRHVARMEKRNDAQKVLVSNPDGKRPLGRPRCRWEYNIKKEILRKYDSAWVGPGHEPVMSCFEHGNEPCGSIQCRAYLEKEACEEGLLHAVTSTQILTVSGCSSGCRTFRSPTTGYCCHRATCNRRTDRGYWGH